ATRTAVENLALQTLLTHQNFQTQMKTVYRLVALLSSLAFCSQGQIAPPTNLLTPTNSTTSGTNSTTGGTSSTPVGTNTFSVSTNTPGFPTMPAVGPRI